MPIIRNPFKKGTAFDDENTKPSDQTLSTSNGILTPGSTPQDIKQPTEYKLSGPFILSSHNTPIHSY